MSDRSIAPAGAGHLWAVERQAIDAALLAIGQRYHQMLAERVAAAGEYALSGGGKRFRGLLVVLAYRACGGTGDASMLAAAVEVAHAYSLVHDDLPCMDDDDVRRGRPTVHRAFDVPTATVAGVAMVPVAVVAIVDAADSLALDLETKRVLVRILMRASGAGGMIGGQLLDLLGEGRALTLAELERIHRGKTGALIAASAAAGGHAARGTPQQIGALDQFGEAVGLAFQITDDVLDVTATTEALGKPARRDIDLSKSTYVVQLGIDGARERASSLILEGCAALKRAGILTPDLQALANLVLHRTA